jgi:hypothetical protein
MMMTILQSIIPGSFIGDQGDILETTVDNDRVLFEFFDLTGISPPHLNQSIVYFPISKAFKAIFFAELMAVALAS